MNMLQIQNIIYFILFFLIFNNLLNFEKNKNQYIQNYNLKIKFYNQISHLSKNKDFLLIDFPDLYKETIFFAHEQISALKIHTDNNYLPNIYKNSDINMDNMIKIKFKKIQNNKIIYTYND